MARRPSRGLPTRRQGKLTMRAAKMGKKRRGKAAGKKVSKRAAKKSKATSGYTPPRVANTEPTRQKDLAIRGLLGNIVMNETRRR